MRPFIRICLVVAFVFIEHACISAKEITRKKFSIGITGGYGVYTQYDLKEFNDNLKSNLNFKTELYDDFPANTYFGAYFLYNLTPGFHVGPSYEFHTTGSRLGTKDFSGSYTFDQIISTHSVGIQAEMQVAHTGKFAFDINGIFGVNICDWQIKKDLMVGSYVENNTLRLTALRPFIYPFFKVKYPVIKSLYLSLSAGYCLELWGRYTTDSPNPVKSDLVAQFSGLRAGLSIEYSF